MAFTIGDLQGDVKNGACLAGVSAPQGRTEKRLPTLRNFGGKTTFAGTVKFCLFGGLLLSLRLFKEVQAGD
jgi:hypothetical protein